MPLPLLVLMSFKIAAQDIRCRWDVLGVLHGGASGGGPQDEGGCLDAPSTLGYHGNHWGENEEEILNEIQVQNIE